MPFRKCDAPVCFYTQATSISSAGPTCASLSVRGVRSSGGRRTASVHLRRRAQPDVLITVFAKEQKGPGPAAAKDATPHPRSQPGPPLPWETTAISTTTCGERQAVGTEGATVPQPAPPPPWRWRYAPWLCPYLVRLSQSQIFSLGMCHFTWLFRCYFACICACLLLFRRAVRDTGWSLTVAEKQEGHGYLMRWAHLWFGQAERLTSSRGDGGDPRADARHQTLWEDLVSGVSARFIPPPAAPPRHFSNACSSNTWLCLGRRLPWPRSLQGDPVPPLRGRWRGIPASSWAAQQLSASHSAGSSLSTTSPRLSVEPAPPHRTCRGC